MLKVENISLKYKTKEVLKNVSFDVEVGSITLIKGISGSGKTSLLSLVGLLNTHVMEEESKVTIDNIELLHASPRLREQYVRTHFGYVLQDDLLIESLTVAENIIVPLKVSGMEVSEFFNDLVEQLGLTKLLNKYPENLSGGERQRVAIARALIKKPCILIADEPTSSQDIETMNRIHDLFVQMNNDYGMTFLIATHDTCFDEAASEIFTIQDYKISTVKRRTNAMEKAKFKTEPFNDMKGIAFFNFYRRAIGRKSKITRFLLVLFSVSVILSTIFSFVIFQQGNELNEKKVFEHISDRLYIGNKVTDTFQAPTFFFGDIVRGNNISENDKIQLEKYPEVVKVVPKIRTYVIPVDGIENYWKDTTVLFDGNNKKIEYPDSHILIQTKSGEVLGKQVVQSTLESKGDTLSENTPDILTFNTEDKNISYVSENRKGVVVSKNYLRQVLGIQTEKLENLEIIMPLYVPSYIYKTSGYTFDLDTNKEILTDMYNTVVRKTDIKLPIVGIIDENTTAFGKENKNILLLEQTITESLVENVRLSEQEKEEDLINRTKNYNMMISDYKMNGVNREVVIPEKAKDYTPNIYEVFVRNPYDLKSLNSKIKTNNKTIFIYNYNDKIDSVINMYQQSKKHLVVTIGSIISISLIGLFLMNRLIVKIRLHEFKILQILGCTKEDLFKLLIQENLLRSFTTSILSGVIMFSMFPAWLSEALLTKTNINFFYYIVAFAISFILLFLSNLLSLLFWRKN